MNFHYQNTPHHHDLLKQLRDIESDLQLKNKQLQQKRKLEEQFYEDQTNKPQNKNKPLNQNLQYNSPNLYLADQVMNELLKGNQSKPYQKPTVNLQYRDQNPYRFKSPDSLKQREVYSYRNQQGVQRNSPQKIENKRQLQKQKLQNQNNMEDYPFGRYSSQKQKKKVAYSPPKQNIHKPQRDDYSRNPNYHQKQANTIQPYNPFTKHDEQLKKKREQEQRNYRKLLKQQMSEQNRKKSIEKQRNKQDYAIKADWIKKQSVQYAHKSTEKPQEQPFIHRRRDPNATPPKYDLMKNRSQDDIHYMKLQVEQLHTKMRKGRINSQQFQMQMKKLERHYGRQVRQIQIQRSSPKKQFQSQSVQQKVNDNPFIKNQQSELQKKRQQQKSHLKYLQQQKQEQRRLKQQQKQKYKQQYNENFNNYIPSVPNRIHTENQPHIQTDNMKKKKRDPNGDFPKYNQENMSNVTDLNFMKMQVSELKMKLSKGRIIHQQYERDIKKLQQHYGVKVSQLQQETKQQTNFENNQQISTKNQQVQKQNTTQMHQAQNLEKFSSPQPPHYNQEFRQRINFPGINPSFPTQNYDQHHPDANMPRYTTPYSPQFTNQSVYSNNGSQIQFQMMLKLFEGLKQIIQLQQKSQESMLSQKKFLEQTFTKFNPYLMMNTLQMNQMNMSPSQINQLQNLQQQQLAMLQNMQPGGYQQLYNNYTQQLPQNIQLSGQRQFQTDKKYQNHYKNTYQKHIGGSASSIHQNPHSESDNSISYPYLPSNIDKSLSGIVNKIPLTSKQKEMETQNHHRDLVKFYNKKYTVSSFKEFEYYEVQSNKSNKKKQIPSVSNYIQSNNAQQELQQLFEADLKKYKQVQRQKQLQIIKSKLHNKQTEQKKALNNCKRIQYPQKVKKNELQEQLVPNNPFLKKHVSNNSDYQQIPTFHEQQLDPLQQINNQRSPTITSKQIQSSQILQQEQYQTQPRKISPQRVSHPKPSNKNINGYSKQHPSQKIINVMRTNDQLLNKYLQTPSPSKKQEIQSASSIQQSIERQASKRKDYSQGKVSLESQQYQSKQYFQSKDISPVQYRQYQSSLETVRSEQDSARRSNMDIVMNMPSAQGIRSSHYQSSRESISGIYNKEKGQLKQSLESREFNQQPRFTAQYCATVQSVQQSASKLPTFFNKPPMHRKLTKSSSRKKEGVIKVTGQSSIHKSNLSGIPSQGSRQKISSSLIKPPQYAQANENYSGNYDSNVYESQYEQSLDRSNLRQKLNEQKQSQENKNNFQSIDQSRGTVQPIIKTQPKWKSLQEARKIARQFRQKSGDENIRKSVEEKLSQFQSFIHSAKKKDESMLSKRQSGISGFGQVSNYQQKNQQQKDDTIISKKTDKKKNIMVILDELQNEADNQYDMDFQSYAEQSQK